MKHMNKTATTHRRIRTVGIIALWALAGSATGLAILAVQDSAFCMKLIAVVNTTVRRLFPYYLPALTLLLWLPAYLMLRKSRSILKNWDGEDETAANRAEMLLGLSNSTMAACVPVMPVVQVGSILYADNVTAAIVFVEFLILGFLLAVVQRGIFRVNTRLHPENLMNIYDLNTVDHYVKRMDEAERKHLGEAAWVSYNATISACFTIDLILFPFQLLFDVGILPTVVSSAIMLVALISITVADYKLTKRH